MQESIVFIYKKGKKYKCLDMSNHQEEQYLKSSGYKHINTINATLWIAALLNSGDIESFIADLED